MELSFYLNGNRVTYNIRSDEYLSEVLRENGILSIHVGCNESACGSCTVLIDDKPYLSCSVLAIRVKDKHITTVEGIQKEAKRLADLFADEGADQCGYCGSAFSLITYALLKENPQATEKEIKDYIVGNLCRCSGYQSQVNAIKNFLKEATKK